MKRKYTGPRIKVRAVIIDGNILDFSKGPNGTETQSLKGRQFDTVDNSDDILSKRNNIWDEE